MVSVRSTIGQMWKRVCANRNTPEQDGASVNQKEGPLCPGAPSTASSSWTEFYTPLVRSAWSSWIQKKSFLFFQAIVQLICFIFFTVLGSFTFASPMPRNFTTPCLLAAWAHALKIMICWRQCRLTKAPNRCWASF